MTMHYAIFNAEGQCINRVLWDGESDWQPPEGCSIAADPGGLHSIYREAFPEPTIEQKLEAAGLTVAELRELLGLASQ